MNTNEQLIQRFYQAFQQKDYRTMQTCYADNATFSDAVFINLNAVQVRAMWEMLITKGKDLQLEFTDIEADENRGSAAWVATYTFSATGKKVVNRIKSSFVFANGRIVQHKDSFDFYVWSKQALGFKGLLLGWTTFLKIKVQQGAAANLAKFMRT